MLPCFYQQMCQKTFGLKKRTAKVAEFLIATRIKSQEPRIKTSRPHLDSWLLILESLKIVNNATIFIRNFAFYLFIMS